MKKTKEEIFRKAQEIHGSRYDYSEAKFDGNGSLKKTSITIICSQHGPFSQIISYHLSGNGCPVCGKLARKLTESEFLSRANRLHFNIYDYSQVKYEGIFKPILIVCKQHGTFIQKPRDHLSGCGCPKCGLLKRDESLRKPLSLFIEQSRATHGNKYDYSLTKYKMGHEKVIILCPIHGAFEQTPNNHRLGSGCPTCYRDSSPDYFIRASQRLHNLKYDYSLVISKIIGPDDLVEILCPKHKSFFQRKRAHLAGQGCPSCTHFHSKPEKDWIVALNNPNIIAPYKLRSPDRKESFNVDGYDSNLKTVYEFYGDFWHGNPLVFDSDKRHPVIKGKTYGQIYKITIQREDRLKALGFSVISMWEFDWKKKKLVA